MPTKRCQLIFRKDVINSRLLGDISPADEDEISGAKSCAWNIATHFLTGDITHAKRYLEAANKYYGKHLRGYIAGYVEAIMDRERMPRDK